MLNEIRLCLSTSLYHMAHIVADGNRQSNSYFYQVQNGKQNFSSTPFRLFVDIPERCVSK